MSELDAAAIQRLRPLHQRLKRVLRDLSREIGRDGTIGYLTTMMVRLSTDHGHPARESLITMGLVLADQSGRVSARDMKEMRRAFDALARGDLATVGSLAPPVRVPDPPPVARCLAEADVDLSLRDWLDAAADMQRSARFDLGQLVLVLSADATPPAFGRVQAVELSRGPHGPRYTVQTPRGAPTSPEDDRGGSLILAYEESLEAAGVPLLSSIPAEPPRCSFCMASLPSHPRSFIVAALRERGATALQPDLGERCSNCTVPIAWAFEARAPD